MSFPLLQLPNELIFNVITQITHIDTLNALLEVSEIRQHLGNDRFLLIKDHEGPIQGFKNINGIPQIFLSEAFNNPDPLGGGKILLIDIDEWFYFYEHEEAFTRYFKGTPSFIHFSQAPILGTPSRKKNGYLYMRQLDVCSVYIHSCHSEFLEIDKSESFDTDNIHIGSITTPWTITEHTKFSTQADIDIKSIKCIVVTAGEDMVTYYVLAKYAPVIKNIKYGEQSTLWE